ncbi:MAG: DUF4160 domain-containing protein [Actinobacteria bacterium]|nr:DUF4160 domain-containing protein [Actinomycetota bacterium]
MSKLRRGGYVFLAWKGDHSPRHVHVYKDGALVVKWDLDNSREMVGSASRRIRDLIEELKKEGLL